MVHINCLLTVQMRVLPTCQCRVCIDCIRGHFEVLIRERYIRNMVCPVCGLPDIDNSGQTDAYFDILLLMVSIIIKAKIDLRSAVHIAHHGIVLLLSQIVCNGWFVMHQLKNTDTI
jgi:hypothetical protein